MATEEIAISGNLVEAIRSFRPEREVDHCGDRITISPFELYVDCRHCGSRLKLRAASAAHDIEDVFDAVFEWMSAPRNVVIAQRRLVQVAAERF